VKTGKTVLLMSYSDCGCAARTG